MRFYFIEIQKHLALTLQNNRNHFIFFSRISKEKKNYKTFKYWTESGDMSWNRKKQLIVSFTRILIFFTRNKLLLVLLRIEYEWLFFSFPLFVLYRKLLPNSFFNFHLVNIFESIDLDHMSPFLKLFFWEKFFFYNWLFLNN